MADLELKDERRQQVLIELKDGGRSSRMSGVSSKGSDGGGYMRTFQYLRFAHPNVN
jgi:hypothetical protein